MRVDPAILLLVVFAVGIAMNLAIVAIHGGRRP